MNKFLFKFKMTPRQLYLSCDIFLLIPLLGLLISVFLFSNDLDNEIYLVEQIFSGWKQKPIYLIQDSYQKRCEEIGMANVINYEWPGVETGCFCMKNNLLHKGRCNELLLSAGCNNIEEVKQYKALRWKNRFICASSMKAKSYFELSKVKEKENCAYKYKKCGVIDTLDNYLCVPEGENCPISSLNFVNTGDDQNVRIETSNKEGNGKIFTRFQVAEEKLCANLLEKIFSEKEYKLIPTSAKKFLNGCVTSIKDEAGNYYYTNINYKKIDSYSKQDFYEHNGIFQYVSKNLPQYPTEINSNVSLYAAVYPGWKKECEKKEFNQFRNSDVSKEISEITKMTEEYNHQFMILSIIIAFVYFFGVVMIKYSRILINNKKIEICRLSKLIIITIYFGYISLYCYLYYIADLNLQTFRNAKIPNEYFEFVASNNCSDNFTNALMKFVAREFISYANRYFNFKVISFISVICSISMTGIVFFSKVTNGNRKKNFFYKNE